MSGAVAALQQDFEPQAGTVQVDSPIALRVLEQLAASDLSHSDRAVLLSLASARRRFGAAWPQHRARAYDLVERSAGRFLHSFDLCLRVNEADFLLMSPTLDARQIRGVAIGMLQEALGQLFETRSDAGEHVHVVTEIQPRLIAWRSMSAQEQADSAGFEAMDLAARAACGRPTEPAPCWPAHTVAGASLRMPLVTPAGQQMRIEHGSTSLVDLASRRAIGQLIQAAVTDERTGERLCEAQVACLSSASLELIDLGTLDVAERLVADQAGEGGTQFVVAPISLGALMGSRTRLALLNRMRRSKTPLGPSLLLQVTGLRDGFLSSRLREAAAMVRPFCRGVFAEIPPARNLCGTLRGAGLRGVSYTAADLAREARISPDPRRLTEAAAMVGPELLISGLRSPRALELARTIGATYGGLDPVYKG